MTVIEATSSLFKFFSEGDYFEMGRHFSDVVLISEDKELDKAVVEAGLDSLVEMGVVVKKEGSLRDGKTYWILSKPLAYYEQKVEVTPDVALRISTLLNEVCDKMGNTDELCDPTNISNNDLANLATIAGRVFGGPENEEENG